MFKKLIFSFLIFTLLSCGTDYMLSSFYLRDIPEDLQWLTPVYQQSDLTDYQQIVGTDNFSQYASPAIVATPDNYVLVFYEKRKNFNEEVIGVNANKTVSVVCAISKNAYDFSTINEVIGGSEATSVSQSHGSPVAFVNKNSQVIVLSTAGSGFGGSSASPSKISKSISVSNSGYRVWSEWEDLSTNVLNPLLTNKNKYNRFYTNPGSGTSLGNGAFACIIDFKNESSSSADGFAILYSRDDGKTWNIGATNLYNGNGYRFARIVTERKDGKLLIAAVKDTKNDFNANGSIAWYLADSLNGKISPYTVTGLPNNSGGTVSGGKIRFKDSNTGYSRDGLILLHSTPDRVYNNPNGATANVKNAPSLSISEDDGASWKLITNIISTYNDKGEYDTTAEATTFRHSLEIFRDGTIGIAMEQGKNSFINAGNNFILSYRRFSLEKITDGKYVYEGL